MKQDYEDFYVRRVYSRMQVRFNSKTLKDMELGPVQSTNWKRSIGLDRYFGETRSG